MKQCHHAIPIIIFAVLQVINISNILSDNCQVSYESICLYCEPFTIKQVY
jgi:hypothetical protein